MGIESGRLKNTVLSKFRPDRLSLAMRSGLIMIHHHLVDVYAGIGAVVQHRDAHIACPAGGKVVFKSLRRGNPAVFPHVYDLNEILAVFRNLNDVTVMTSSIIVGMQSNAL